MSFQQPFVMLFCDIIAKYDFLFFNKRNRRINKYIHFKEAASSHLASFPTSWAFSKKSDLSIQLSSFVNTNETHCVRTNAQRIRRYYD